MTRSDPRAHLSRPDGAQPGARGLGRWRVALLALGAVLAACDDEGESRPATRIAEPRDLAHAADQAPRLTQELMLALAQAKNFHHRAKVYMSDGDLPTAMASVRSILSLRFPPGAPEAEDVRADARALLAKLMMGRGEHEQAEQVIAEGLAEATRDSFFIANLYTVRGELYEAMAEAALAAPGGAASAAQLRRKAIEAFDRSISINRAIQERLVEGLP